MSEDRLYQCSCGNTYTSKVAATAHALATGGNHIIKRVR